MPAKKFIRHISMYSRISITFQIKKYSQNKSLEKYLSYKKREIKTKEIFVNQFLNLFWKYHIKILKKSKL